jgi:hypothetical protein
MCRQGAAPSGVGFHSVGAREFDVDSAEQEVGHCRAILGTRGGDQASDEENEERKAESEAGFDDDGEAVSLSHILSPPHATTTYSFAVESHFFPLHLALSVRDRLNLRSVVNEALVGIGSHIAILSGASLSC